LEGGGDPSDDADDVGFGSSERRSESEEDLRPDWAESEADGRVVRYELSLRYSEGCDSVLRLVLCLLRNLESMPPVFKECSELDEGMRRATGEGGPSCAAGVPSLASALVDRKGTVCRPCKGGSPSPSLGTAGTLADFRFGSIVSLRRVTRACKLKGAQCGRWYSPGAVGRGTSMKKHR
jgi:hypothetical protein